MADEEEGWARLAKNLKAEIDPELIKAYRGTVSLPFEPGKHERIAVKIVERRRSFHTALFPLEEKQHCL